RALSKGGKFAILPEKLLQYRFHSDNLTHKDPMQTFWEYAYISSKTLHPWLMGTGSDDLVLKNIVGFLRHELFNQLNQNERSRLASALLHNFKGTFQDFSGNRNYDQPNHRIGARVLEAYAGIQLELDQLWEERNRLREERDRL